ncbi:Pimeloyl-[acyl-carrier protein] methyl ester esterase [Roseovarius sp. THAF27]|uniref:alpha/beta fold hydrolase n=1 Tax=Roseovarius sp. THAF27 TaxID=2587850 RepID=UPI0012687E97|nr:alpha/beta hydrolase [Roseovarius sp. THAF27]QFT79559.1 Pimeloyl-[acyl-carrier protein] methyl ester esterase [Roseovarius sp. THAF27]
MPEALKAGFPTYWTTFGQGPQPALAIHCSLAHSGSWGALARHLSGALTLTAFDMPGHGRSGAWDGRGEIQEVTAEIAADLLDGPAHVIGHSFGATVALRLAVMRPELVRSLVLIEPVFFAVALADCPEMRDGFEVQMAGFANGMRAGDPEAAARGFLHVWGNGTEWESLSATERKRLAGQMHLVEAGHPALYEDAGAMLAPGVLQNVSQPVLLIEGSDSPDIISVIDDGLASRLPRARRAVIAGAGHMAPLTHARQVGAEILRFLGNI